MVWYSLTLVILVRQLQPIIRLPSAAGPSLMAAELLEARELPEPGKSLAGLGKLWDEDTLLRDRMLQKDSILDFGSTKKMGVISFETMSMNYLVLSHVLSLWLPQCPVPKTVNIEQVRDEDRGAET